MTKEQGDGKLRIREAAVAYIVDHRNEDAVTTISSKNQITLPVHLLRELGLEAGDRLAITRDGDRLVLRVRPRDWVTHHAGSLAGVYGKDQRAADEYVREQREGGERDAAIERAWADADLLPR